MKITRWASSLVGREDEVERKTWVGEKNLSPIKQLLKRGHIVWREHVHIQARMHTLYNQLHELWCFGSAKKEEIGGHTICPPACVCIAYASLDVLCMSCYAISMSKLYSGAAFRHRQHRRLFPPISYSGLCIDTLIYIPSRHSQRRHKLKRYERRATQPQVNWHAAKGIYFIDLFIVLSDLHKSILDKFTAQNFIYPSWRLFNSVIFQRPEVIK